MNRIDFSNLGGNPIDQDSLAFMQASYTGVLSAFAKLCGDKTIITGLIVIGSNVSDGWISYNGEPIPFIGGAISTDVVIEETATAMTFEDQVEHDVEFTKVARFGTPGTFPFAQLKRLPTLQEVWLPGDLKEVDCNAAYIAANFDATGLGIGERKGWAVCNGNNGTKNRGGRVSVGYSTVTVDPADNVWDVLYNTIGATGGEKEHALTELENGPHKHGSGTSINRGGGVGSGGLTAGEVNNGPYTESQFTASSGLGNPHENRQPFIVTLFIQKL